ncbi:hypothetical protein NA56DRAFT_420296 [Hyaloscypha hepaticicola]|uniref:Uncharacterized protein n=1 Tax=Hyaloscypha hepaticicola TaxID=2082293 RepID=A0A2J6PI28_9HELO|nr:hypothetical protein NA56DRAFT_420296 [Hyaloscypha hepaticicola]
MKFFAITVVSLSMGCQVLAAPIDPTSAVASVQPIVETLPSEAVAAIESLPMVNTATPAVPDTGLPIPKRDISITTITTAVSGLHSSVSSKLSTIMTMSASNATTLAAPMIKSALTNVATKMNNTITSMAPAQALLSALADMESMVFNIKTTLSTTMATVHGDAMTLIAPEIATVLGLVLPLLSPLTAFVYSIAGLVPGGDAKVVELTSAAGSVMGVASSLLSPVEGLTAVGM